MAFKTDTRPAGPKNGGSSRINLLATVQSVDVQKGTMVVVAKPEDNNGQKGGTFTVCMDLEAIPPHVRQQSVAGAGGGFCGAVIDKMTERQVGKRMILESFKTTGESTAVCRWLNTYKHERQRRPGLVHTTKAEDGSARITAVTVFDHNAFSLDDENRLNALYERADQHFRAGTTPLHTTNDKDQVVLRSSMPQSVLTMVIVDKATGEVLENTVRLGSKEAKNSDFPDHYSEEERKGYGNRPPRLPRNGEDYKALVSEFSEYAKQAHPGKDLLLLGVEGIQYKASRKTAGNRNMQTQGPVEHDRSPLGEIHRANMTSFRIDPSDDESTMRGAYIPTINIQFSPNRADTYNRYIDVNAEWPERDVNWLSKVMYADQALVLPEALSVPVRNAQRRQVENSTPANSAPQNAENAPNQNVQPPIQQAQQEQPTRTLPEDPAFDKEQSLDMLGQTGNEPAPNKEQPSQPHAAAAGHEPAAVTPDVGNAPADRKQPSGPVREDDDIIPSECPFMDMNSSMDMGL